MVITSNKGEGYAFDHICLFVCLLAGLRKNSWMDMDAFSVDRGQGKNQLINFWTQSGS